MSDKYILDASGEPIPCEDLMTWGKQFESQHRIIGKDTVGVAEVSTVFLGLNHRFGPGAPLLFETMIFGGEHDQWCDRYSTREQAVAGHAAALKMVQGETAA